MPELLQRILACDIIYCGDYHSLRQSQMTNLALLAEIVKSRKAILATELVYAEDQDILDRYIRKQISEEKFLRSISYDRNFGFDWNNYRPIFDFASEHAIPVIAIDHKNAARNLYERDRAMAASIARASSQQPDSLLWVMIGDMHLAQTHLPAFVEKELSRKKPDRKVLILHQNNEDLLWKVARQGLHGKVEIIKMNSEVYCILNTPPWMKVYSYVSWLENADTDSLAQDLFVRLVASLTEFLKIDDASLLDCSVYAGNDCSFLSEFGPRSRVHRYCQRCFEKRQPFVIPAQKIVYLPYPDLDLTAEIAGRYIHTICSGYRPRLGSWDEEFYRKVCHHALGFLSSKLFNHHRPTPPVKGNRLIKRSRVCHYYGSLLGDEIYTEMLAEKIDIKQLRRLFSDPFTRAGSARAMYDRFCPID